MDARVAEFSRRFFAYADASDFPVHDLRRELLTLHATIEDEGSRTELLRLFHVLSDVVESHLADQPEVLEAFKIHRQQQTWLLVRAECLRDGEMDNVLLRRVTGRELRAGRMTASDPLRRYALGDMNAFNAFYEMAAEVEAKSKQRQHPSSDETPLPNTPEFVRMLLPRMD